MRAAIKTPVGVTHMPTWPQQELDRIAASDDLHIAPFREDGATAGTPTWIWSVVVDGALYVRPYHAEKSRWYQAALKQRAGRITAAGMARDVTFAPADAGLNDRIDAAYRAKYAASPYLPPMLAAGPRGTTIKISPR